MNYCPLVSKAFFTRSEGAENLGRIERHSEKLQHDFRGKRVDLPDYGPLSDRLRTAFVRRGLLERPRQRALRALSSGHLLAYAQT